MSGDSPNSHRNELFDFSKDGRNSPIPTSSREITLPPLPPIPSSTTVQDAVLVEPAKDKESEEKSELCSPCSNNPQDDSRYEYFARQNKFPQFCIV